MKTYEIYFELFGKKMKCKIEAPNKEVAEDRLRQKIQIHSIRDSRIPYRNTEYNNPFDFLTNIINEK